MLRIFRFGVVVAALLGCLLCLGGVVALWSVEWRVKAIETAVFRAADDSFGYVDAQLGRVEQAVRRARERLAGLSQGAQRLQEEAADVRATCQPLLEAADDLFQELRTVQGWLDASRAVIDGVDRVSAALVSSEYAAAHPDAVAVRLAQNVQELTTEVQATLARVDTLRSELRQYCESGKWVRTVAKGVVGSVAEVDSRLTRLSGRIEQIAARVTKAREACAGLGRRIRVWLSVGYIALGGLLIWFAVSQMAMLRRGWQMFRQAPGARP